MANNQIDGFKKEYSLDELKNILEKCLSFNYRLTDDFDENEVQKVDGFKRCSSDKVKIGNVDAYKIVVSSNYNDNKEVYLFIYNDIIYQIEFSLASYYTNEIENIIKNIKFN